MASSVVAISSQSLSDQLIVPSQTLVAACNEVTLASYVYNQHFGQLASLSKRMQETNGGDAHLVELLRRTEILVTECGKRLEECHSAVGKAYNVAAEIIQKFRVSHGLARNDH
jgi:hypothetical protein